MNSLIFISTDPKKQEKYLEELYTSSGISLFDRQKVEEEGSIGVETVRKMQTNLYLAPYQGEKKSIAIYNAQTLTTEAQNALLKVLEEPPLFVQFILLATTLEQFLPTIISRCTVILSRETHIATRPEYIQQVKEQIKALSTASVGEKLALAEKIAGEKEMLEQWFVSVTTLLRTSLLEQTRTDNNTSSTLATLQHIQKVHMLTQTTNVSPRVLLEHMLLSL